MFEKNKGGEESMKTAKYNKNVAFKFSMIIMLLTVIFVLTSSVVAATTDLTADQPMVPATTELDTTYPVNVDISNNGDEATGEFEVRLFDNGISVGTQRTSVAAGSTSTITFNWQPKGTGTRTLTVLVDSLGEISETNEKNNAISTTTNTIGADLTASFTVPPTTDLRTTYPIQVNVINNGNDNAGEFDVRLFDNGITVGTQRISLNALSSTTLTFNWKPRGTGTRTLTVLVDPVGEIRESNERNNAITATTVTYDKPELTASFEVPSETEDLEPIPLSVNVINNGGATYATGGTGEFNVRLFDNGICVGTQRISLNALEIRTLTFNWRPRGIGEHTLTLLVDSLGEISESNERNNVVEKTANAIGPELEAYFEIPSETELNINYPIYVDVTNNGDVNAGEFTVKLFDNGVLVGTQRISLDAGITNILTFDWTPTTIGSHTLTVLVDSLGEISEDIEDNNLIEATTETTELQD